MLEAATAKDQRTVRNLAPRTAPLACSCPSPTRPPETRTRPNRRARSRAPHAVFHVPVAPEEDVAGWVWKIRASTAPPASAPTARDASSRPARRVGLRASKATHSSLKSPGRSGSVTRILGRPAPACPAARGRGHRQKAAVPSEPGTASRPTITRSGRRASCDLLGRSRRRAFGQRSFRALRQVSRTNPKSSTMMCSSRVASTLGGFKSPCSFPAAWIADVAATSCGSAARRRASSSWPAGLTCRSKGSPWMGSMVAEAVELLDRQLRAERPGCWRVSHPRANETHASAAEPPRNPTVATA